MRERLPDTRRSITHRVKILCGERPVKVFITVGMYENGHPGEVFLQVDEKGTTLSGLCIVAGILLSLCLQNGVGFEKINEKLSYQEFEPKGMTDNPDIHFARSVIDYTVKWMEKEFKGRCWKLRKEVKIMIGIKSEHWADANGNPAGGNTVGTGFVIGWQNGPLGHHASECKSGVPCVQGCTRKPPNGAFVEDVIEAAADRIRYYQRSHFACEHNAKALGHLEAALAELKARTKDRETRGIEGTHKE